MLRVCRDKKIRTGRYLSRFSGRIALDKKPMIRKCILFSFALLTAGQLLAQEFAAPSKFEDKTFKIFWRATSVKPRHDFSYGGWTFNIGVERNERDKWGKRVRYENPTLGDMFVVLARTIQGKTLKTESGLEHSFGSGFLGWLQYYSNAYVSEKLIISPGISLGDYIYALQHFNDAGGVTTLDPAGYFFHAGPGVMVTYLVGGDFWLTGYLNYDIPYYKAPYSSATYTPLDGYKHPHFLTLGVDLNHRSPLYVGLRMNQAMDRGGHKSNAKRFDISVGVNF